MFRNRAFKVLANLVLVMVFGMEQVHASSQSKMPLVVFTDCSSVVQISVAECQALVDLYNSTDGANWLNKTGWLQTNTPCDWYGIYCNAEMTHVTILSLSSNHLSGTIPPAIGNLTSLNVLTLFYNQLTGDIPAEIGNLTSLQGLYLAPNKLTGEIPASFVDLVNLEYLGYLDCGMTSSNPSVINFINNSPYAAKQTGLSSRSLV